MALQFALRRLVVGWNGFELKGNNLVYLIFVWGNWHQRKEHFLGLESVALLNNSHCGFGLSQGHGERKFLGRQSKCGLTSRKSAKNEYETGKRVGKTFFFHSEIARHENQVSRFPRHPSDTAKREPLAPRSAALSGVPAESNERKKAAEVAKLFRSESRSKVAANALHFSSASISGEKNHLSLSRFPCDVLMGFRSNICHHHRTAVFRTLEMFH